MPITKLDAFFTELMKQTNQRGGCPSTTDIMNVYMGTVALLQAYNELRTTAMFNGVSMDIAHQINKVDEVVAKLTAGN